MTRSLLFTRLLPASALATTFLYACGAAPAAPQTTTPPAVTTTPVVSGTFFESGGIRLSYTIDRPTVGTGPFPGIVLGHEGGVVTKDELFGSAMHLVAEGFVVLRYDKRGTGFSSGEFAEVSPENSVERIGLLAADMAAAVQTLKAAPGVDPARIGLFGVSQAGWVMPLAATLSPDVKFVAAVVGPTIEVGPLYYFAGLATDASKSFEQLSALIPGYTGVKGYNPRAALDALSIPMLYQMGTTDRVVPYRESAAVLNELIAAGKPITLKSYPNGHELRELPTFEPDLHAWLALRK